MSDPFDDVKRVIISLNENKVDYAGSRVNHMPLEKFSSVNEVPAPPWIVDETLTLRACEPCGVAHSEFHHPP